MTFGIQFPGGLVAISTSTEGGHIKPTLTCDPAKRPGVVIDLSDLIGGIPLLNRKGGAQGS